MGTPVGLFWGSCIISASRIKANLAQARLVVLKRLTFELANILRGAAMTRYAYHSPSWRRHTRTTSQSSSNRIHSGVCGIRKSCGIDCAGISAGAPPSASPTPGSRMTLISPGMRHPRTTAGTHSSNECGFVGPSVMRSQPPDTKNLAKNEERACQLNKLATIDENTEAWALPLT